MKKLHFIYLLFILFALSCRSEDGDTTNFRTDNLVGVWKITNLKVAGKQIKTNCDLGEFIFNKDGNAKEEYLYTDNGLPDPYCEKGTEIYLKWFVSGNQIIWDGLLYQPTYNWHYEFKVINKKKLIIYGDDDYEYTVEKQ